MSEDVTEFGNTIAPFLGVLLALMFLSIPSFCDDLRNRREGRECRQQERAQRKARYGTPPVVPSYPAEWERHE
jgi:hypothetical protein